MQASLGLDTLRFDPRFMRELPADPSTAPGARQVAGAAYARVLPTRVAGPSLVAHSREMAAALGIDAATVASQDFADGRHRARQDTHAALEVAAGDVVCG